MPFQRYRHLFLPHDATQAGLCRHTCPSVRSSVRPSVTFVDSVKTSNCILRIFSPSGSQTILVFLHTKPYGDILTGTLLKGASNANGLGKNRDSGRIAHSRWYVQVRVRANVTVIMQFIYTTHIRRRIIVSLCLSQSASCTTTKTREFNTTDLHVLR